MPICYQNPDGSHVEGCTSHMGKHPLDWCRDRLAERLQKVANLSKELARLRTEDIGPYEPDHQRGASEPASTNVPANSWRRLFMQTHPIEPGLTYVSYYTSPDGETWQHFGDDIASIYLASRLTVDLTEQQQFIGLASLRYTRSELLLVGPDGPSPANSGPSGPLRNGPVLPVYKNGHEIGRALLCFWEVRG